MLKKEKGEWRLVVDYQGLNEQTKHDSYSLPLIDTILQKQAQKHILTVLDLKHSYYQKRCSRNLTLFLTTSLLGPARRTCRRMS